MSDKPSWLELARAARATVAAARHGSRDAALAESLSALKAKYPDLKLAKQTLRTAMLAAAFVDEARREDASYAKTLSGLPAIIVETLSRWHRFDAKAAKRQARSYADGKLTLRGLMDAERAARHASKTGGRTGRSGRSLFEDDLPDRLGNFSVLRSGARVVELTSRDASETERVSVPRSIISKIVPAQVTIESKNWKRTHVVDCAVLIAGPYADSEVAFSRLPDWILKALGLTFYFKHVVLALANYPNATDVFREIPDVARNRITVLVPR